jgi:hypothetical protein
MLCKFAAAAFAFAVGGALSACAPVATSKPPLYTDLGTGRVVSVQDAVRKTGESQVGRVVYAGLLGGIPAAVMASGTEADLGNAHLHLYNLTMKGGAPLSGNSYAFAAVDDCVKVTRQADKPELLLEKIDKAACLP